MCSALALQSCPWYLNSNSTSSSVSRNKSPLGRDVLLSNLYIYSLQTQQHVTVLHQVTQELHFAMGVKQLAVLESE